MQYFLNFKILFFFCFGHNDTLPWDGRDTEFIAQS